MKNSRKIKWKALTLSLVFFALLQSCKGPDPQKFFAGSSSVSLEIYISTSETIQLEHVTDPQVIDRYVRFISNDNAPSYTCGYEGRIVFTKEGAPYDVNFTLDSNCRHFAYLIGDAMYSKKMTDEGEIYILDKIKEAEKLIDP